MFCYIQEIEMKSSNSIGCGKELVVMTSNWTVNGVPYISYGYAYSDIKFERPIKTAYKISIHDKSYRDDKGKVRKRQFYLTTIKYYDLVDYSWYDCIMPSKVNDIAEEMGINPEILWKVIEEKLDALQDKVNAEFAETEEYQTKKMQDSIIQAYQKKKVEFAKEYEVQENEYDKCYDIFGKLRNPDYLEKIKNEYQSRKAREDKKRSYQGDSYSNYNKYSSSGGINTMRERGYSEQEKVYLKKFYRVLASKYHPDVTGETETMQFINKLKEQWGV